MAEQETPPNEEEQFGTEGEGNPPIEEPQVNEELPASEDVVTPQEPEVPVEGEVVTPQEPQTNYYTPEEMKTLQVDGIDTSRIPPEMVPLYQAMQAPITRKSQELSEQMKTLEQGNPPLQEQNPQAPQQQPKPQGPSLDETAVAMTMQKLGLQEKPEPWANDGSYENYMMELSDTRRDLKDRATKHSQAMSELNTFKSGFTPEQFKDIDSQAETKMYKMLGDPATKVEGQRIQRAMQTGDTNTILSYMRDVAKEVLIASPTPTKTRTTPPVTTIPQGSPVTTVEKDPSKMNSAEYRAYREAQSS